MHILIYYFPFNWKFLLIFVGNVRKVRNFITELFYRFSIERFSLNGIVAVFCPCSQFVAVDVSAIIKDMW